MLPENLDALGVGPVMEDVSKVINVANHSLRGEEVVGLPSQPVVISRTTI